MNLLRSVFLMVFFGTLVIKIDAKPDSTNVRILKLDLRSVALLCNPKFVNQTLRVDYQYFIKNNQAFSIGFQSGNFNTYSYTKYYDFFGDFNYINETVDVSGFHLYSSYDFFPFRKLRFFVKNFSVSPAMEMFYYTKHKRQFVSKTNSVINSNFRTIQLSSGFSIAYSQKIWKNIVVDALLEAQYKLFTINSNNSDKQHPLNGFWMNNNKNINLNYCIRIGYEF